MIDDVLEKIVYMGYYILPSLDKYRVYGVDVRTLIYHKRKKIPFLLSMSVMSVGVNVFLALSSLSKQ